jgi:hypothetical protein
MKRESYQVEMSDEGLITEDVEDGLSMVIAVITTCDLPAEEIDSSSPQRIRGENAIAPSLINAPGAYCVGCVILQQPQVAVAVEHPPRRRPGRTRSCDDLHSPVDSHLEHGARAALGR